MMDAVGEVNHRVRKDELRPQSFRDLLAVQRRPSPREDDDRDRASLGDVLLVSGTDNWYP